MNQNEYHPNGIPGYTPQNNSFPQNNAFSQQYPPNQPSSPQYGYGAYPQSGTNNAAQYQPSAGIPHAQNPYNQGRSYDYPQAHYSSGYGFPYTQQNQDQQAKFAVPAYPGAQSNGGSYIPQTPYSPGYTTPGYQPPQNGYQAPQGSASAGYNPYGQMGKTNRTNEPLENYQGIPLNGGGYVPQNVHIRRRPFVFKDWYLFALGFVLIALFILSAIILKNGLLKFILILLSLSTAGVLWIKPLVAENKRLTYSVLALALSILTAVSFLPFMQSADNTRNSTASGTGTSIPAQNQPGVPEIPSENSEAAQVAITNTPAPAVQDDSLMIRLVSFFNFWNANRQDEMLTLCAPSWQSKQENPRTALFGLLANRRPENCTPESISGTDADTTRRVTLTTMINRNNNKPAEKYRMTIVMVKENNEWYVDPNSLASYDPVETPDPNITATPAPTPTAAVYSSTLLYYNPKGGEYYHLDSFCKTVNAKYAPLQGQFTYAEINTEPYSKLKPCNVCGAPLRED